MAFQFFLKVFREQAFLTVWGTAFHSLGAAQEKDPLYKDVLDFDTYEGPLSDDLRFKLCAYDIGFNRFEMYSGVKFCNAL